MIFFLTFVFVTYLPDTDNTNVNILSSGDNCIVPSHTAKPFNLINK